MNLFQYSFVTIHSFCFIVITETVVQLVTSERNHEQNISVKNPLTNNCNKILDTT